MFEVVIDNKDGTLWNITKIVSSIKWKTSRVGRAGSCDVKFIKGALFQDPHFKYSNGDIITIKKDNQNVFYGYIFAIDSGQNEEVKVTAYDQIRYLLYNDTYVFKGKTATEIIQKVASDAGIRVGNLADTKYKVPKMVEDNKKLLDVVTTALDHTMINTKKIYVLYDEYGFLTLRDAEDMTVDISIGDNSEMTGFKYKTDIDTDTYNRVKIVQDNKKAGNRKVFVYKDSNNIRKWGRLQYFQIADEKMNEAQINQIGTNLIEMKNREQKKLTVEALGNLKVRAGCYVQIKIAELKLDQNFLVDECTHDFDGDEHTMKLELKVY